MRVAEVQSPANSSPASWSAAKRMLAVATAVVALDQISKQIAIQQLGPDGDRESVSIIGDFVQLHYVENDGVVFGFFAGSGWVAMALTLVAVAILLAAAWKSGGSMVRQAPIAVGLIAGGAVGNLIDRLRHGFVVDFIDVGRWPAFNLADAAVTTGLLLALWTWWQAERAGDDTHRSAS